MGWREELEQNALVQYVNDLGGQLRYGMPTAEKEAAAYRGEVPGANPANMRTPMGQDMEQRRASAYFFSRNYPNAGPYIQPAIDFYRLAAGDDPRVVDVTREASEQGSAAGFQQQRQAAQAAPVNVMARNIARYMLGQRYGNPRK